MIASFHLFESKKVFFALWHMSLKILSQFSYQALVLLSPSKDLDTT